MGANLQSAGSQFLRTPYVFTQPAQQAFTVGCWFYATTGGNDNTLFCIGQSQTFGDHWYRRVLWQSSLGQICFETSVIWDSGSGPTQNIALQNIPVTPPVGAWCYLVARFLVNDESRLSVWFPGVGVAHVGGFPALSTTTSDLNEFVIGARNDGSTNQASGIEFWNGFIAEYFFMNGDIHPGGSGTTLPDHVVLDLAFRGPLANRRVLSSLIEYRSFRKSTVNRGCEGRDLYFGISGIKDLTPVFSAASGLGVPIIGRHPPLDARYYSPPGVQYPFTLMPQIAGGFGVSGPPDQNLLQTSAHVNASLVDLTHNAQSDVTLTQISAHANASLVDFTHVVQAIGPDQNLSQTSEHVNASVVSNTHALVQGGIILIVDSVTGGNTGAGALTMNFNIALQPGDVVYVWGGFGYATAGSPSIPAPTGYTNLYNWVSQFGVHVMTFAVHRKVMGATPDTSVTIGVNTISRGQAYGAYVLRNANSTPEDVAVTSAKALSGDPDPPSITTVSNGALVLALFGEVGNDSAVTIPSGYGNQVAKNQTGTSSDATIGGGTKSLALAGAENPGQFLTAINSNWHGVTIAVRPGVSLTKDLSPLDDYPNDSNVTFTHVLSVGPVGLTQDATWPNVSFVDYVHAIDLDLTQTAPWPNASFVDFVHVLSAGAVDLAPINVFTNPNSVNYTHSVQAGANNLIAVEFENANQADYVHTIAVGDVALTQTLKHDNAQTLNNQQQIEISVDQVDVFLNQSTANYQHTIDLAGITNISPDAVFPNASVVNYQHVIDVGPVILFQIDVFANAATLDYQHVIAAAGPIDLLADTFLNQSITNNQHSLVGVIDIVSDIVFENLSTLDYQHDLTQFLGVEPETWQNDQDYFQHAIAVGAAQLVQQQTFVNQQRFRQHTFGGAIRQPAPRGASAPYGDPGTTVRPTPPRTRRP